jgi:hypothetical protein
MNGRSLDTIVLCSLVLPAGRDASDLASMEVAIDGAPEGDRRGSSQVEDQL